MPLMVLITVLFAGAFLAAGAATGFLTIVFWLPELPSLESLIARPLPTFDAAGAAVLFPRPAPPVVALCSVTLRAGASVRPVLAFSTLFVRMPAAPPGGAGAAGLSGETGRASSDFPGDTADRTGERGTVRELADRGERTWEAWTLEVVRAGGTGGPRGLFFGFSMSSFSLSVEETSSLAPSARHHQDQNRILASIASYRAAEMD